MFMERQNHIASWNRCASHGFGAALYGAGVEPLGLFAQIGI